MKRLTKRVENGNPVYYLYGLGAFDEVEALSECVSCLAAYEDTGLEPEEVQVVAEMFAGDPYVPILQVSNLVKAYREGRVEISPPNNPLALEQLREMDGVPVWVSWAGHSNEGWALVRVWSKADNILYLTYHNGASDLLRFILDNGARVYRRKPEESL